MGCCGYRSYHQFIRKSSFFVSAIKKHFLVQITYSMDVKGS